MNERIKELAEQARKHFPNTETSGEFWVFDEEKFAELIVRECAEIAYAGVWGADQLDEYDRGWQNGRNLASELIKQHFRVKE